jgi:hypothetical protein
MRIVGTLSLDRKQPPPEREKAPLAGRLSLDLAADQLNLNTSEANALQRFASSLWEERNRWDIARRASPNALEREITAWRASRGPLGKAVRNGR